MAERSTAAVGVANESGKTPLTDRTDGATADEKTDRSAAQDAQRSTPEETTPPKTVSAKNSEPPELHSGHKLARRYRLEECVTRLDGFSSWRAVDEKLRRAVGIHILPADHARARRVLAAARSAALLGDPRFVQVLDAVDENDLVYVIHEWLPDATSLTTHLASGPLEPHDAYQLVSQVSQAMAAAHREGLAHLRLTPGSVLRTETGQYRIRGLAVAAALRGLDSERPQREDTEAIGALLYAALTRRWPYPESAHGLTGLPEDIGLVAPDQVRAGVHRGLSGLAMRALANDGATASRQEPPCTTPEELAKAVAAMPKIRPPEPTLSQFQRASFQQGGYHRSPARPLAPGVPHPAPLASTPPPALPGRTGQFLKWSVSALLIAALGLGSWQLADTLMDRSQSSNEGGGTGTPQPAAPDPTGKGEAAKPLTIRDATEYYPDGNPQDADQAAATYDNDASTIWRTKSFDDGPKFAPSIKEGVGIVYDLGSEQEVREASLSFLYGGNYTGIELYATDSPSSSAPLSGMTRLAATRTDGTTAKLSVKEPEKTRYVLVWLTALPHSGQDGPHRVGHKQAVTEVAFKG